MSEETGRSEALDGLRQRAQEKAGEAAVRMPESQKALSPEETKKVFHELRVHQIELEMQNEELRRAQEELEVSRARYFDLYELAPVGYLSVSEEGLVVQANLTFAAMVGVARARGALLQQPLSRFILPNDANIHYLHRQKLRHTGDPQACELRMLRKGGAQFWAMLEMTSAEGDDGATVCRVVVSDITERKQAEDDKAKLQEQFVQAQKMEMVGRLAGGVAHDLNNLLTPILGYGDLLLRDLELGDAHKEFLEQIVLAAERARDIVGQLLAFSRKQMMVQFTSFDLGEVTESFATLLRFAIREDIDIQYDASPTVCRVLGDRGQLERAIMNLAINAQDAMPEGGVLSIDTSVTDMDAARAAGYEGLPAGRYSVLAISDTGRGMDAETKARIFEPFFTTKLDGHGSGLGLSMVYGIVKQHGGGISVSSEPGMGTTVEIYLPFADGRASFTRTVPEGDLDEDLRGVETILLVEDELSVRDLTQAILERLGYTVVPAENGLAGLKVLKGFDGPVQLVVTDAVMPWMGGKEMLAKILEEHPNMRALLMSGYVEDLPALRSEMGGVVSFIQKPFTIEALARKVREVLDA